MPAAIPLKRPVKVGQLVRRRLKELKRTPRELASWVMRDNPVPPGSVLLTGTGLVPPDEYTLEPGHTVEIEIEGIGLLSNTVAA